MMIFGTCHPFFHPPGYGRVKQFVRILRGFLSCLEKANSPFFELFHTQRPFLITEMGQCMLLKGVIALAAQDEVVF